MASLTIRRLDDSIKARLRARAAHRGRSMEEEAREILKLALAGESPGRRNLADSIRRRFSSLGGVELPGLNREPIRGPEVREMIVLDTNVLSEVMKPSPSRQVLRWLAGHPPLLVFTATITQAEILYGVELLPEGKRKVALQAAVEALFGGGFRRKEPAV